ncbi:hypothetical protein [Clostridium porci]|uniref:Uncharacterized protein n=1 Tax=Clostridium porci TaxID=2605778 RepID=A0A7X2NPR6_9CLOT|nr:hypothetical protein [Clostridium porci]MSS38601.1 hypothetical protein [Clostridium porci]
MSNRLSFYLSRKDEKAFTEDMICEMHIMMQHNKFAIFEDSIEHDYREFMYFEGRNNHARYYYTGNGYDNDDDISDDVWDFSKKFPNVIFVLDCEGEDGKRWREYYKNGKKDCCKPITTYREPYFDKQKENNNNKWKLTDDDSFQIRKERKEDVFELYQIDSVVSSYERGERDFRVSHAVVYLSDIDTEDVLDCYGYESLKALKEEYGDDWKGILAECDFELTSQNGECFISPDMTWDEAKQLICELSGYSEGSEAPKKQKDVFRVCGLQFPVEDGITTNGIQSLLKMANGNTFDFILVDAEASAAIFLINSEVYAQWESEGILQAFKAFIREILDDKEKETEDGMYQFEDARILNENGTVATHIEEVYLGY